MLERENYKHKEKRSPPGLRPSWRPPACYLPSSQPLLSQPRPVAFWSLWENFSPSQAFREEVGAH